MSYFCFSLSFLYQSLGTLHKWNKIFPSWQVFSHEHKIHLLIVIQLNLLCFDSRYLWRWSVYLLQNWDRYVSQLHLRVKYMNIIRGRPELSTFPTYEITPHNFLTLPSAYEIYIFHRCIMCRSQLGESASMDLSMANHPIWWHSFLHKSVHSSQHRICCTKVKRLSTFSATPSPSYETLSHKWKM